MPACAGTTEAGTAELATRSDLAALESRLIGAIGLVDTTFETKFESFEAKFTSLEGAFNTRLELLRRDPTLAPRCRPAPPRRNGIGAISRFFLPRAGRRGGKSATGITGRGVRRPIAPPSPWQPYPMRSERRASPGSAPGSCHGLHTHWT